MSVLVAGFGNVFLSDDGLAASVIPMLHAAQLGSDVTVRDFGTGGMHLALEMLGGYDRVIIVDAVARDDAPGTVFAIDCTDDPAPVNATPDPHVMGIASMLALYRRVHDQLGSTRNPQIIVVGCVPQNLNEGMELSKPVRDALPACAALVRKLVCERLGTGVQT